MKKLSLFVMLLLSVSIIFSGCASLPEDGSVKLYRVGSQVPEELYGCKYAEINATCNLYWMGLVKAGSEDVKIFCKIYKDIFTEIKVYNTRFGNDRYTGNIGNTNFTIHSDTYAYKTLDDLIGPFKINFIIAAE